MESEKVKEIKKALEERTQHTPTNCHNGEYVEACGMYCRFYRRFVVDMGSKNGQICKNCIDFTATNEVKEDTDILTLINELESENERLRKDNELLRKAKVVYENVDYCYEDLKKAQDRIAELEKENGELLKENEGYRGSYRCAIDKIGELSAERYIKVEQFAERLKEKVKALDKWYSEEIIDEHYNGITTHDIDKTLKEFINE